MDGDREDRPDSVGQLIARAEFNRAAVLLRQGDTAATRRDLARFVELGGSPTTPLHRLLESPPTTAE
jgi:hypothetical protein